MMKILITGYQGFIGKNLVSHLQQKKEFKILKYGSGDTEKKLEKYLSECNFIFHLAGINRSHEEKSFVKVNIDLTKKIINFLEKNSKKTSILFTSSSQASLNNIYGKSKLKSEEYLKEYAKNTNAKIYIYRLKNVFGKWSKPNYNSVVATFCHKLAMDEQIIINDTKSKVSLVYIDDVITSFMDKLNFKKEIEDVYCEIPNVYDISIGDLANKIKTFKESRNSLVMSKSAVGLDRALYSTFLSYLKKINFSYKLKENIDERGKFVEILKTRENGQFSYLTAPPGATRGCHYHHTKSEKFLVVSGRARIRFRNILTNDLHEIEVSDRVSEIIDTIPGWVHDISNIGDTTLVVLLWANEIFDKNNPDTIYSQI